MKPSTYEKLKTSPVLFDRELGLVSVAGPDRVSWLQGMVTNDVARLVPGRGCYAAHLNPQGKMLSHMVVLADEDSLWLVMERSNVSQTVHELERLLIMEDASIDNRAEEVGSLSLAGAGAQGLLEEWAAIDLDFSSIYDHVSAGDRRILRTEWGFDIFMDAAATGDVREVLLESGAVAAGEDFWDVLRIESGFPRYGVDVDETTTFPELGDRGIDYDKGCYIGQEVVAKIKYIGHVNRKFVGLKLSDTQIPDPGAMVHDGGQQVGRVTSAIHSLSVGAVIALAFVRRGSDRVSTELSIDIAGAPHRAEVVDLPFVHSPR